MSESQAHAILRAADIRPHLSEQWLMTELGPDFDLQAAEVCGLYLDQQDLAQQMLAFVETYNQTAKPFQWTYTGKVLTA